MYYCDDEELHDIEIPADDTTIWRYMDFTKYVSLICTSELFFARADSFDDGLEGKWSKPNHEYLDLITSGYDDAAITLFSDKEKKLIQNFANNLKEDVLFGLKEFNKFVFINCWHINESQSYAMWKIYSNHSNGVAIKSTVGKLKKSFKDTDLKICIGKVKYIDFKKETIPLGHLKRYFYKNKCYEYENELRAIHFQPICYNNRISFTDHIRIALKQGSVLEGLPIKINLETLIDSIFVSPKSEKWIQGLLSELNGKYNLTKPIVKPDEYW